MPSSAILSFLITCPLGACSAGLDGIDAEYIGYENYSRISEKNTTRNQDSSLDFKLQQLGAQYCDKRKKQSRKKNQWEASAL